MKEMSLTQHLEELRSRLIRIVFILLISFVICYSLGEQITEILLTPLRAALGNEGKVVFLGLLDKVLAQFQLAFWSSVIFSSPLWFYQLWSFIKPALYDKEVKVLRPFVFVSFLLFCAGVLFGHLVVFPFTFETILAFGVSNIEATISMRDYIVLASKVLVLLGVLFQLPNLIIILNLMGLTTLKQLNSARRYVISGFAVLAAMITPPDVITMMSLWIPLVVLYEIGVLFVAIFLAPWRKKNGELIS